MKELPDLGPDGVEDTPDQLSEALKQKAALSDLTKSPAWSMVVLFIDQQIELRKVGILSTTVTDLNKDDLNTLKGEYLGLELVLNFVKDKVFEAQNVVDLFKAEAKLREDAEDARYH